MAKKKDQNEDPEEEKKNQFDDDEDFGLPDLDYDELEEEADEELGESVFGDDEPDIEETPPVKEEEVPAEVAETSDQPDEIDSEMDMDMDEDWEKELEDELEEDLKSGDFEEVDNFYEEESFDEFEQEVEQEAVGSSVFGSDEAEDPQIKEEAPQEKESTDDFYAAPEETKEEESTTEFKPQYSEYLDENKSSSKGKFARTVLIGAVLFMVVGGILYFLWDGTGVGNEETEVAVVEEKTPEPVAEESTTETASEEVAVTEEPVVEEPVAEKTAAPVAANPVDAGTISTLTERTGKSYLIIASFFDGDMAQDYAKELSDEGKSPFVIPPFKEHRYYRVAIAEYDNFTDAKSGIESYKAEYEVDVWPLRY